MNVFKIWNLAKGRKERLGLVLVTIVGLLERATKAVPYGLAYMAGTNPLWLVLTAVGIYAMGKAGHSLALFVGEMIGKRQAQEQVKEIEAKLQELFAKARSSGQPSNVFKLPPLDKKVGGIN